MAANQNQLTIGGTSTGNNQAGKKDISHIKCYVCGEFGHYASAHDRPASSSFPQRPAITANSALPTGNPGQAQHWTSHQWSNPAQQQFTELNRNHPNQDQWAPASPNAQNLDPQANSSDAGAYYPKPAACLLPIGDNPWTPAMAAQTPKNTANRSLGTQAAQPPSGIRKTGSKQKDTLRARKAELQEQLDKLEAGKENLEPAAEDMELDDADEGQDDLTYDPPSPQPRQRIRLTQPKPPKPHVAFAPLPISQRENLPPTRLSKTGKVQELVTVKSPKLPDPIRGILGKSRFGIQEILKLPLTIEVGQFLDKSDVARQELALSMQKSTPKYRVKKATSIGQTGREASGNAALALAASVQKDPPLITARAHEDDGQSQPLMVTSWIGTVKLGRTLLDGGSIVELVNRRKLSAMDPPPRIYTDGHLRVSLATDAIHTLTNYTMLPVNLEGVEAIVRAWVVDNRVYDLLPGVPWMRRVGFNVNYATGRVTISGDDGVRRHVPAEIFPLQADLPTVEIADAACQILLDEQKNDRL